MTSLISIVLFAMATHISTKATWPGKISECVSTACSLCSAIYAVGALTALGSWSRPGAADYPGGDGADHQLGDARYHVLDFPAPRAARGNRCRLPQ